MTSVSPRQGDANDRQHHFDAGSADRDSRDRDSNAEQFGGIVAVNRTLDATSATKIAEAHP
jgi:hypothetical protein